MGIDCILIFCLLISIGYTKDDLHLTSTAQGYLTVIQGFATQLQCQLNSCSSNINWYKDDQLLFNSTQFVKTSPFKEESYILQHKVDYDHAKDCSGSCSDVNSSSCPDGSSCLDNQCCPCIKEEYMLILRNLTFEDSGRYRCQVGKESEQLEFQVEVLESGLRGGFHENISYDHSQCCEEKGISPLCQAMCKPSEMASHYFDPTSCKTDDYKNFLSCATDGGNRSHVHCCKTQLVPSFCYDLCSADFTMLRRSHRLCLYYLPEIFDCYNRAYLPYPDPPDDVTVNAVENDKLEVCWKPPKVQLSNKDYPVIDYTVYYKQIPSFPFLGGGGGEDDGIPLLSGDYADALGDVDYGENASIEKRKKRSIEQLYDETGIEVEEKEEWDEDKRIKRQTWVFVTRDDSSNSSTVREFTFSTINTTKTCATIEDLRSATRYIVYVTSRNGYGTSVPSIRSISSTNIQTVTSNATMPDAMKCCEENGVSSYCRSKMCSVDIDPSSLSIISIATTCRHEWPKVSPCVADGRNHTDCCVRKGVQKDCLNICNGSAETLGVHSVLCLNLDLGAIYQCLREGYESHPSPPMNVRVESISERTAQIVWDEPLSNAHLVETYTLFIRKNEHGAPVRTVTNAISPHIEMDLDPDSSYAVSVQSHSEKGTSLPSTTVLFQTLPDVDKVCTNGDPLYMSNGKPFICGLPSNPCPIHFTCTETDDDEAFCCPNDDSSVESFDECCRELGISHDCLSICTHNITEIPEHCSSYLNDWIRCSSDGHDHSRCCLQEEITKDCLSGCTHPFTVPDTCITETSKYSHCFSILHSQFPLAVRNLQITELTSQSASIKWDYTANMDVYEVQLFTGDVTVNRTNTTTASITFSSLTPLTQYSSRVIAFNKAGSSPPSFNLTFSTLSDKLEDGDDPLAPKGVRIEWNRGSSVNITWDIVNERVNGEKIDKTIQYTLYFVDSEISGQWQTIRTNDTWAVMSELRRDAMYSVYVTASEGPDGPSSLSSSVMTLTAQSDSFGLPEPTIVITPNRSNGVYSLGEKININCSINPLRLQHEKLNLDLTIGDDIRLNEPGESFVSVDSEASESFDTITCSLSSSDGRQNTALKHILVKFGPSVRMEKEKVRSFDDLSAEITCIVEGFPIPDVHFEYQNTQLNGETRVRTVSPHVYAHTLLIKNVTGRAGWYSCNATREGNMGSARSELVVSTGLLPVNPRLVLDCCEQEGIEDECLEACTIGEIRPNLNCTKYASSLLKCAIDNRDHGDCCREKGVLSRCLPLCSGDSFSPNIDCSTHAVSIMSCFVRGHESSPLRPQNMRFSSLGGGKVRIEWENVNSRENYVYFAIYYKKADDDDDDYTVVKSRDPFVELDLEEGEKYEMAVTAANAYGHSPLIFIDVQPERSESRGSTFFFILFIIIIAVIGTVIYLGRRLNQSGSSFSNILHRNQGISRNDPTVAFENPGFGNDLGDEVEIRGLGSVSASEWQNTDVQAGSNTGGGGAQDTTQNGMRYSKLRV